MKPRARSLRWRITYRGRDTGDKGRQHALKRTLLLGVGNPDRQDDGVAWHVLRSLAIKLKLPAPATPEDEFVAAGEPRIAFHLQLTPEMAEEIQTFERVCFVDAHTGNIESPVNFLPVAAKFQNSPFTHHLTPQSLLSMCQALYGKAPEAVLLSVCGYKFEFEQGLSSGTASLLPEAVGKILSWL